MQSYSLCALQAYSPDYLLSFQFLSGFSVFMIGITINTQSDSILRSLRKGDESGYLIPRGGAFEYVSGAHYFGEIVEWTGFAMASNAKCSWAFSLYTASNLIPRAEAHHAWYLENFKDYPPKRKAVIPFFW